MRLAKKKGITLEALGEKEQRAARNGETLANLEAREAAAQAQGITLEEFEEQAKRKGSMTALMSAQMGMGTSSPHAAAVNQPPVALNGAKYLINSLRDKFGPQPDPQASTAAAAPAPITLAPIAGTLTTDPLTGSTIFTPTLPFPPP